MPIYEIIYQSYEVVAGKKHLKAVYGMFSKQNQKKEYIKQKKIKYKNKKYEALGLVQVHLQDKVLKVKNQCGHLRKKSY